MLLNRDVIFPGQCGPDIDLKAGLNVVIGQDFAACEN